MKPKRDPLVYGVRNRLWARETAGVPRVHCLPAPAGEVFADIDWSRHAPDDRSVPNETLTYARRTVHRRARGHKKPALGAHASEGLSCLLYENAGAPRDAGSEEER